MQKLSGVEGKQVMVYIPDTLSLRASSLSACLARTAFPEERSWQAACAPWPLASTGGSVSWEPVNVELSFRLLVL